MKFTKLESVGMQIGKNCHIRPLLQNVVDVLTLQNL